MGLSIHYNGKFNREAVLFDMITEVKDIVETFDWKYRVYQKAFPLKNNENQLHDGKIYGISFMPPNCETISLCFLSNYRMSSFMHIKFYGHSENEPPSDYLYMLSTKTQYAGPDIHKTIIELFRYLEKRNYFSELNLVDEAEYWETGDEKILEQQFKKYDALTDSFSLALETIPAKESDTLESYFERIIKLIDQWNKK